MCQWLSLISKERKAPLEGDSELKIHLATLNLSPEEPHFHKLQKLPAEISLEKIMLAFVNTPQYLPAISRNSG